MHYLCPNCDSAQRMVTDLAERLNNRVMQCARLEQDVLRLAEQVRALQIAKDELLRQSREASCR